MLRMRLTQNERGIALITVLLVALVVGAISVGAALIMTNISLINRYNERQLALEAIADAGIEVGRSALNGNYSLYPDTAYNVLESGAAVVDAGGASIPNVRRWVYVGPTGITSGQYGVFGSVVSVAEDDFGNRVVRRGEIAQESFAKFAYFTDIEPSNISFGGGDQLFGPVHTNSYLKIYSSGATFWGPVTTALTVQGGQYGTFAQGYTEGVPPIPMPQTADLVKLRNQAQSGNTSISGNTLGGQGEASTRIEFIAIDLNGDGDVNGANEGFFRVYQSADPNWVTGEYPSDYSRRYLKNSENCGHYHADGSFVVADDHPSEPSSDSWQDAISDSDRRCYLGGSDSLSGGFNASDGRGQWLRWPGAVSPLVAGRADGQYLFPLSRQLNPGFKGVIYVEGKVAISGVLRGQVTLAATTEIIIADDVTYATDPGAGTCNDMLGLFSGGDVVVADNTINAPVYGSGRRGYLTYDDSKDEFIHGIVLALDIFTVERYWSGPTSTEWCETRRWGRGCLYLSGGIIQRTRGAVATLRSSGGTGNLKRYSYDQCAFTNPPPYFPTTGYFFRSRYYEVDPVGFDVDAYYRSLTPN